MKKKLYYIICLCSLVSIMLCACNNSVDSITETVTFQATVIEVTGNSILVHSVKIKNTFCIYKIQSIT